MSDAVPSAVYLWPGALLLAARRLKNRPHRHLAASILLALDRPFILEAGGSRLECRAALVAPDARQSLDSQDAPLVVIHLDPDLPAFRRVGGRLDGEACHRLPDDALGDLQESLREAVARPLSCEQAGALLASVLDAIAQNSRPLPPLDPRIERLARELRADPPERLALAPLAAAAGLSQSRLMHLFRAGIGVPLGRFILNLRLQQAMRAWRPGMTLADLAMQAGFYDQPHLARTAREMLDFMPSALTDASALRVQHCGALAEQERA